MIRGYLYAALIILGWGAVKTSCEQNIDADVKLIKYGESSDLIRDLPAIPQTQHSDKPTTLARAVRDNVGQSLAIVALGGFRGLAANFVWLNVHQAWTDRDWVRLRTQAEIAVQLQPRSEFYWENGAWHMAWNASTYWERNMDESNPSRRDIEAHRWIEIGRDFLDRGIKINPQSYTLLVRMGDLYANRLAEYHQAYLWYAEAAKRPDAPLYVSRLTGHWLMKAGEYDEAYKYFIDLGKKAIATHETNQTHLYLIQKNIQECEKQLHIPPEKSFFTK